MIFLQPLHVIVKSVSKEFVDWEQPGLKNAFDETWKLFQKMPVTVGSFKDPQVKTVLGKRPREKADMMRIFIAASNILKSIRNHAEVDETIIKDVFKDEEQEKNLKANHLKTLFTLILAKLPKYARPGLDRWEEVKKIAKKISDEFMKEYYPEAGRYSSIIWEVLENLSSPAEIKKTGTGEGGGAAAFQADDFNLAEGLAVGTSKVAAIVVNDVLISDRAPSIEESRSILKAGVRRCGYGSEFLPREKDFIDNYAEILSKTLKKDVMYLFTVDYGKSAEDPVVAIPKRVYAMDEDTRDVLSRFHVLSEEYLGEFTRDLGYGEAGEVREVCEISREYVAKVVRKGKVLEKEDLDRLNERALRQVISDSLEDPTVGYEVEKASRGKEQLWFPLFSEYYTSGNIRECENNECMRIFIPPKNNPKSKHCSSICSRRSYYKKNVHKWAGWMRKHRNKD